MRWIWLVIWAFAWFADASYWDAELVRRYVHNSETQRRWAMAFMAPYLKEARGDERVLDVGCGDGKITADVSCFVGKIVGVDPSAAMIDWAGKQFPWLRFQRGGFLEPGVEGPFDWVVSFCALQHCPDQLAGLQKARELLKAGGKLLVLVPALHNPAWNEARKTVQGRPEWAVYWKQVAPRKFLTVPEYLDLLQAAGLEAVSVREVDTLDPFVDLEELLVWLEGTFTPVVPLAERRLFYCEWVEEYLKLDPNAINEEGVLFAKMGVIQIEARKNLR